MKSPSDYDALDDIDADVLGTDEPEPDGAVADKPTTYLCDVELDDGTICGESFKMPMLLGGHKRRVHGIAGKSSGDKSPKPRKAAKRTGTKSRTKPPEQKAAEQAAVFGDRTAIYTSSLAFIGLVGHVAIPPFDDYDLSVWNAGAPGLAAALDEVGAVNPAFRQGCDLVLGGGAGGAYVKLVLALAAMATPIAAHHGFLPAVVGERFGAQIGVAPAPESTPTRQGESEPTPAGNYDPNTPEGVLAFLGDVPPRVGNDLNAMMMQGAGPTVVASPDTPSPHAQPGPSEEPDGERGPENLNPEREPAAVS